MNRPLPQLTASILKTYECSWIHIVIALVTLFSIYKIIAFQIGLLIKALIVVVIAAVAYFFIYQV